jgi:ABC-2 type transport system ATP-binding protein
VIRLEASGDGLDQTIARVSGVTRVTQEAHGFRIEAAGDLRPQIARAVIEAGGSLTTIAAGHASLDDVYARYFEEARDAA